MPELPDVEVYKQYIDATSLHKRIVDVTLHGDLADESDPQTIRDKLAGSELIGTRRHGKHLFVGCDGGWLQLHFGMTGYLDATSNGEPPEHTELLIEFEDGSRLAYVNQRKFGSIEWVSDVDEFIVDHELGPDPLADEMDVADLRDRLEGRRGSIKGTLMSQDVLAGLGNVYVDEILFQAGIHPESETQSLDPEDLGDVFQTMIRVIDEAIDRRAEVENLPGTWLLPHRETASKCPRDEGVLSHKEVSGRSTYFCPKHQRRLS